MADVFICYSTYHPAYAYVVEDILRANNYTWFRDQLGIRPAAEWVPDIDKGIREATVLVAFVTREAIKSREVKREIALAQSLNKPCLPLVMERIRNVGSSLAKLGLDKRQAIDFSREHGLVTGTRNLLDALQRETDTWTPLAQEIVRLGHFSPKVRTRAVETLGESRDLRVLAPLLDAFEDESDPHVEAAYARQMVFFDDVRAVRLLLNNRNSVFPTVARPPHPQEVLQQMRDLYPATEAHLIEVLETTEDERQKMATAQFISINGNFGPHAQAVGFETLVRIANESDTIENRDMALHCITYTGHPDARRVLEEMRDNATTQNLREFIEERLKSF